MSAVPQLPQGARPLVAFPAVLRANGFAVAPEQTEGFLAAVGLLGPKSMADIYRAARAMFAPGPDRLAEFDALYRWHFLGHSLAAGEPAGSDEDEEVSVRDERDGTMEPPEADEIEEAGAAAASAEALRLRRFAPLGEEEALARFRRAAPALLPRRRSYRRAPARRGDALDMRRLMRDAVRRDGEVLVLPRRARKTRQRRILFLLDISGSMKGGTERSLRFAHSLVRAGERVEVFTLGTRLTRVTRALRHRNAEVALATAATTVADWDGGTRLGDALQAFLAVPRFKGFARGALVVVLSDGLERGDPAALVSAVEHLARLAWSILWLSPLAADPRYRPETAALNGILPHLGGFADAGSLERIAAHVLAARRKDAA